MFSIIFSTELLNEVDNYITVQYILTAACDGVSSTNWGCCSSATPCGIGGGDCDGYEDCQGELICGENNCKDDFSTSSSNWDHAADCCVRKYIYVDAYW